MRMALSLYPRRQNSTLQLGLVVRARLKHGVPRHEVERQTARTTAALFSFTADCLDKGLHLGLLESEALCYRLWTSTVTAGVPESFF